jgi:hypothetical protein
MVIRPRQRSRSLLVVALLALAGSGAAQGAWDGLPAQVVATIERSVASALAGPEVRLARQRVERAHAATLPPSPRWEASVGARSTEVDVLLHGRGSLAVDLIDPSRPRALAAARTAATSAELDAWLAAHDAALDALTTWLAAWASRERAGLARAAAEAPTSSPAEDRRRRAWRDRLPALDLEARIWEDRLRAAGAPSPIAWPSFDAWRRWVAAPWEVGRCTAEPVEVRVARAEVARLRGEDRAASQAEMTPSLRLGLDLSISASVAPAAPVDAGVRVWLRLGAPSGWSTRGALEVATEGRAAELDLRVGSDPGAHPASPRALVLEAAEARLAASVREARERRALARTSWAAEVAGLVVAPSSLAATGAPLADVEALIDVVTSTVAAVQLRAESRAPCVEVPSRLQDGWWIDGP